MSHLKGALLPEPVFSVGNFLTAVRLNMLIIAENTQCIQQSTWVARCWVDLPIIEGELEVSEA